MKRLLHLIGIGAVLCSSVNAEASTLDGDAIYRKHCIVCHSIMPPPKSAPAMIVTSRYHRKYQKKEDGVDQITAFLKSPSEKNTIDPIFVTKFGLMAPLSLQDSELRIIAEWVWDLYNPTMGAGRVGGGWELRGINP